MAMQRSSKSIGAIAAALAKAQAEITNPEKSLTATIRVAVLARRGPDVSLRPTVKPGSTLVRKALGRHEIAIVQTTIDNEAGLIRLLLYRMIGVSLLNTGFQILMALKDSSSFF